MTDLFAIRPPLPLVTAPQTDMPVVVVVLAFVLAFLSLLSLFAFLAFIALLKPSATNACLVGLRCSHY
jgi:hypothetical protein